MNTRPARVPNVDTAGYQAARRERRAILVEQRVFLESFNRQVAEIESRDELQRKEGQE
jgi:predicted NUDIX family NTP pyrophosphohydrolase